MRRPLTPPTTCPSLTACFCCVPMLLLLPPQIVKRLCDVEGRDIYCWDYKTAEVVAPTWPPKPTFPLQAPLSRGQAPKRSSTEQELAEVKACLRQEQRKRKAAESLAARHKVRAEAAQQQAKISAVELAEARLQLFKVGGMCCICKLAGVL